MTFSNKFQDKWNEIINCKRLIRFNYDMFPGEICQYVRFAQNPELLELLVEGFNRLHEIPAQLPRSRKNRMSEYAKFAMQMAEYELRNRGIPSEDLDAFYKGAKMTDVIKDIRQEYAWMYVKEEI